MNLCVLGIADTFFQNLGLFFVTFLRIHLKTPRFWIMALRTGFPDASEKTHLENGKL